MLVTALLWLLLGAAVLLVIVLVMPLRIEMSVVKDTGWRCAVALRPAGRFGPRIALPRRPGKKGKAEKRHRPGRRARRLPRGVPRFLVEVVRRFRVRSLDLKMRVGLGDPAETGHVFGLLMPLVYSIGRAGRVRLDVEPVFDEMVLTGRGEAVVSVVPVSLVGPVARLGWASMARK